jgi:hypothetical protein
MGEGPLVLDDRGMPDRSSLADLALSRPWLARVPVVAALFPAWAVLRGFGLSFYFEPTDTALYAARVGHALMGPAAVAVLVLVAVAVGIRWVSPVPDQLLTAGVAVGVSAVLGLVGLAWVNADRSMHPFGPELRAVSSFPAPSGAGHHFDSREASDHPEVSRYWEVAGSLAEVCRAATASFSGWAEPGTVAQASKYVPDACWLKASRAGDIVELQVSDRAPDHAGSVLVVVSARRP